ncbi:flavin reductase family protein [Candidatus Woesearchaeota archaeon]|nr:flavin reductase family protein [Candidatus Woesearchaeota archaeon]
MDLPWGDERCKKFVTNVGLITSHGPHGNNIMAAEWTHHVSYEPGLIAICLDPEHATTANIKKTKEFGVSLCAVDQNVISSVSGTNCGRDVDKIAVLKELGFVFSLGKKTKVLLIEGAALNIECKLVKTVVLGDHVMFVGEALATKLGEKEPIVLHAGKYWKLETSIAKPSPVDMEKQAKVIGKYKKK